MEWPVIAIVLVVVLALGVVAALVAYKKRGVARETNYRVFFYIGVGWLVVSGFVALIDFYLNRDLSSITFESPLFTMGIVFFIIGIANKDKWEK